MTLFSCSLVSKFAFQLGQRSTVQVFKGSLKNLTKTPSWFDVDCSKWQINWEISTIFVAFLRKNLNFTSIFSICSITYTMSCNYLWKSGPIFKHLSTFRLWIIINNNKCTKLNYIHSIANNSLFPTFMYLHSNSTQTLALKKNCFFTFSGNFSVWTL